MSKKHKKRISSFFYQIKKKQDICVTTQKTIYIKLCLKYVKTILKETKKIIKRHCVILVALQ